MLSPCLLLSSQPGSFLSPPETGNHSLGSSTVERPLVFAFCFQQLGAAGGGTSRYDVWLTKGCLVKAALHVWSSAPLSTAGQGPNRREARSDPVILQSCPTPSLCSHCRAEHDFTGPGRRRIQADGVTHLKSTGSRTNCRITA